MDCRRLGEWIASATLVASLLGTVGCDASRQQSDMRLAEGLERVRGGNTLDGVRRLNEATTLDPDNGAAWYYLGMVRLQEYRDPNGAVEPLSEAAIRLPREAEVQYQLGLALVELGRTDEALTAFDAAIAIDPEHARALYRKGRVAEDAGAVREAIDDYTRAIYADPRFTPAYSALGDIYVRFGRPREAMQALLNGIQNENPQDSATRPARGQARATLGRVFMELQDYDAAVRYLAQAAELRPESTTVPFNLGIAYRERVRLNNDDADRAEARRWLERARNSCNRVEELARCESIEAALNDLNAPPAPE